MGTLRGLIALLLAGLAGSVFASSNVLDDVRLRHEAAQRLVADVTMEREYEPYVRGYSHDDVVTEWVMGWKWLRQRVWEETTYGVPTKDLRPHRTPRERVIEVTASAVCNGYDIWVAIERGGSVDIYTEREYSRIDPAGEIIDYRPPVAPYMQWLPRYGEVVGEEYAFGRECLVVECEPDESYGRPVDGQQYFSTVWVDREDLTVVSMTGWRYFWNDRRLDSVDVQLDNTRFTEIRDRYDRARVPEETVVTVDGRTESVTTYWYNLGLPDHLFAPPTQIVYVVWDRPWPHPCPKPHPPCPPMPHPGPPGGPRPDPPTPRPGERTHPEHDQTKLEMPQPAPKYPPAPKQPPSEPKQPDPGRKDPPLPPKTEPAQKQPPPPVKPTPPPSKDDGNKGKAS